MIGLLADTIIPHHPPGRKSLPEPDRARIATGSRISQDYQSDAFEWDVVTHGPLLGFSIVLNF